MLRQNNLWPSIVNLMLGAVAYDFKIKNEALIDPGKAKLSVLNHYKSVSFTVIGVSKHIYA